MSKALEVYRAKRNFKNTPEPTGAAVAAKSGNAFVIQKHAARRMHYDFRLELDGVLKSWAVPEGPSLIVGKKRLAVATEDHPLEYGGFEGVIPKGEYGGGTVMIWDRGTWTPVGDPQRGYTKGHLKFILDGAKLKGGWHLVRLARKPRETQDSWLLFKSDDAAARSPEAPDILQEMPDSAATGRSLDAIAQDRDRTWSPAQGATTPPAARLVVDAAAIPGAKAATLPPFVEPALPSAVDRPPSGDKWVHEIKHDGYRLQVRIADGRARLLTRQGLDWSAKFPTIVEAAAKLPVQSALIDSEVVVQSQAGVASFSALVEALKSGAGNFVLFAFDLLHLDGYDLRKAALLERKEALAKLIPGEGVIRYSEHIRGDGETIFRHAGRLGLEGIVSKSATSPYQSGRVKTWLKTKSTQQGPFVVAGFFPSTVARNAVGSLVLAEHVDGHLVASGHVGSGFNAPQARALWEAMEPLRRTRATIVDENAEGKGVRWIEPQLVAEIEYRGRTPAGIIRHATFRELAENRDPRSVVRAAAAGTPAARAADPTPRLTNPNRLLWPEQGITKQGLADFYAEIAPWVLPHIARRPLSLLRCPEGIQGQCFFQKHRWAGIGDAVKLIAVPGDDETMVYIEDLSGLLALVQAGVLEIHPWGARIGKLDRPDRATIDLDPGDDVPWENVVAAAREVRERLAAAGLISFVKTTGGKGLHVVFPLTPQADWATVKRFTQLLAEGMAADTRSRYTANMAKRERGGRIFIDYLRNGLGATAVGAYSTRARPGAAISTPLAWDELGAGIRSNHFTVETLPTRLEFLDRDPWKEMTTLRQKLPKNL